jgi:hypothetical protein
MTTIVMSGNVSGTTYTWTRDNQVNVTGIPNAGSGNISGTPINNTTVQQTVIFTITPTANGCPGAPITATLIVNKAPTITCPANITVNSTPGQCGAIVTYPPANGNRKSCTGDHLFTGIGNILPGRNDDGNRQRLPILAV